VSGARIAAQPSRSEAAIRRDAVARWTLLRSRGLTAEDAAKGVGASRASLYRWAGEPRDEEPATAPPASEELDAGADAGGTRRICRQIKHYRRKTTGKLRFVG